MEALVPEVLGFQCQRCLDYMPDKPVQCWACGDSICEDCRYSHSRGWLCPPCNREHFEL